MGWVEPGAGGLLERDEELGALTDLLRAVGSGRGCLALVEGPAGIGKSCLLRACADAAEGQMMIVLRVRGDELLMESSFAAVRELLWPAVRLGGPGLFDGAVRWAAPVFEGEPDAGADRDRVSAVLQGLYWLVASLAERGPLALLIDDAHLVDVASARFLTYMARRIEALPALLAVVVRTGETAGRSGLGPELMQLAASVLRPGPFSEQASGAFVRRVLGPRADEELCRSCHEATRGNPFYLRELAVALRAERDRPTVELARLVRGLGVGSIGASVLVRFSRLGDDCERLARSLAVLGPGAPLRHAASMASLDRERATAAADVLHAAELLSAGLTLSFAHPIVAETISAQLPPAQRAELHSKAARLLAADGAPADRVAAHLLFGEPYGEAWVVDWLRAAAREALVRGAPEAAVSYLRRAQAEPPADDARLDVLLELGRAETLLPAAHDFAALRTALGLATDPGQRAEIALELALGLFGAVRSSEARLVLENVLEREHDLDQELVQRLEQTLIGGGIDDLAATQAMLARADRYFEPARRGALRDPRMLATLAIVAAFTGTSAAEGAMLARAGLRDERLLSRWLDDGYVTAAQALCWTAELAEAAEALERGIVEAERRGSAPMLMQLALVRSETALRAGDLDIAERWAERALELGRELDVAHIAATGLLPVLLERGRSPEASELVEQLEVAETTVGMLLLAQRGMTRIARGQPEIGVADLLSADQRMAAAGLQQAVQSDWVPAAAAALVALERHEEAQALARRELAQAAAFGAPPRHGLALSVCGSLERGERGLALLREGVAILERSPGRLEHVKALVNLGVGLRVRGLREQAREPLARALDLADAGGAVVIAERARAELVATGARPRRASLRGPHALTPAEARTAQLAASGLTNRQIAQQVFVTKKTVETQLSHAYAKLGIRGRSELPSALGGDDRLTASLGALRETDRESETSGS